MISRRTALASGAAALAAAPRPGAMYLSIHQTTSVAAGFRKSLEGWAKAGIRYAELIPAHINEFVKQESLATARRLLADLNIKAVASSGSPRIAEPGPGHAAALETLKANAESAAALGIDRLVCPCNTNEKFALDDYKRAQDNLRAAGDVVKPFGVTVMVEFMRGSSFIGTLPTSLNLTRDTAHPNIRSMFDFYHFWAGLSKIDDLDLIRPGEIHHVHFQDVPKMPRELRDNSTRDIPGDGVSPLKHILQALKKKGYSGPVSVELFYPKLQKGDPYEVAMEIRRKCEPILKQAGVA